MSLLDQLERAHRTDQWVSRVDYLGPIRFRADDDDRDHVDGEFDARLTDDGFLRIDGAISSVGVYQYSDGEQTWGELRTADEVFDKKSMASFAMVPVTDDHPSEMVNSTNVKDVQRGHLGSNIRADADRVHLLADMIITDADLIQKIKDGKSQLSNGYQALVVSQDGVADDGTPFSAVQTKVRGNHTAVVDLARGGPTCRLLLDAVDGAFSIAQDDQMKVTKKKDGTVVIDGTEHAVPDAVASAFQSMQAKLNEEGEEEESEDADEEESEDAEEEEEEKSEDNVTVAKDSADLAKMQAKIDSMEAQLKAERDSSSSKIDARVALVVSARDILGADHKTDGVSDIRLMRQVVASVSPTMKAKVDKGSLDYVSAAYEMALDTHNSKVDSTHELLTLTHEAVKSDGEVDLDALYSSHLDSLRTRSRKEAN